MAFVVDSANPSTENSSYNEKIDKASKRDRFYSFQAQPLNLDTGRVMAAAGGPASGAQITDLDTLDIPKTPRQSVLRRSSTVGDTGAPQSTENRPALASHDLWEIDDGCHNAAMEGDFLALDCNGTGDRILVEGLRHPVGEDTPRQHRRAATFDASQLMVDELEREAEVFNERLHGYVRQTSLQSPPPAS